MHGPLRNIHIELAEIKKLECNDNQAKSKTFKKFLKVNKRKAAKKLFCKLNKISINKQNHKIQKVVKKLLEFKNISDANEKAFKLIDAENKKVVKNFINKIQTFIPNSQKSIHEIRVEAKKLRYRYEILMPAMIFENINLQQLIQMQDALGEIQNYFVLQKSIRKYRHNHIIKESLSVLRLQKIVAIELQNFMAFFEKINGVTY
jgi:CHAD domain-containing protein